jgi:hypothetical protein
MKGYSELCGQNLKLDFDTASGQFVSKPITHTFAPNSELHFNSQKLEAHFKSRQQWKAKHQLKQLLTNMSPTTRDGVGMTEFFAVTHNL